MKNRKSLLILISLIIFFSCNNVTKNTTKEVAKPIANNKTSVQVPNAERSNRDSLKTKNYYNILAGINYSFTNGSFCQSISLKEISKNEKFKIPEKLTFKITLHDKQGKLNDKIFKGVAKLFSPEESFSDNSEKDGGDYDAADYHFDTSTYRIIIRIDIENYEACVVSVRTSNTETALGGYSTYLKDFPNDGVMKRGECK